MADIQNQFITALLSAWSQQALLVRAALKACQPVACHTKKERSHKPG
jgi:hypothetical protein